MNSYQLMESILQSAICQASKQLTLETTIFDPLIRGHLLSNNLDFKLAFIL